VRQGSVRPARVAADPDLTARGLFFAADRGGRPVPQVGLGISFDGSSQCYRSPPPALGEHTEAVLADWLGWGAARVAALRDAGVI
jgi:crotonobetainyl-CoA:carnitine CoA-transferase CaiB-like acyl-CoA transferase